MCRRRCAASGFAGVLSNGDGGKLVCGEGEGGWVDGGDLGSVRGPGLGLGVVDLDVEFVRIVELLGSRHGDGDGLGEAVLFGTEFEERVEGASGRCRRVLRDAEGDDGGLGECAFWDIDGDALKGPGVDVELASVLGRGCGGGGDGGTG